MAVGQVSVLFFFFLRNFWFPHGVKNDLLQLVVSNIKSSPLPSLKNLGGVGWGLMSGLQFLSCGHTCSCPANSLTRDITDPYLCQYCLPLSVLLVKPRLLMQPCVC